MSIVRTLLGAIGLRQKITAAPVVVEATPQPAKFEVNQLSKPEVEPPRRAPRCIPTYVLADRFVKWLQASGSIGYYLVPEIDELVEAFCTMFGYEVPGQQEFRSYLAETRGVTRGRYRLKSWEFRDVAKRTTIEKPILYRIPSKTVSETISSDFYAEVANGRPMGVNGHSEGAQGRTKDGQTPAKRGRRPIPKRKMVLPQVEIDGNGREIEARKAA